MFNKAVWIFGLVQFSLWAVDGRASISSLPDGRIVGGYAADIRQFPHQVSLQNSEGHFCGGSIIAANVVVTAAHCVEDVTINHITVAAGATFLSRPAVVVGVAKAIVHKWYSRYQHAYDIALLILSEKLPLSKSIQPIQLTTEEVGVNAMVTVTGWGRLEEAGNIADELQQLELPIVSYSRCKSVYPYHLTTHMLCAGVHSGGKDACQGDSGGPMIFDNKLLGIVSFGSGCARAYTPGVYISIPHFITWIQNELLLINS